MYESTLLSLISILIRFLENRGEQMAFIENIPDLSQFHHINNKGDPTGVYDEKIFQFIKMEQDLFVCGGIVYIYENGYFKADRSGARLKTMISYFIYPEFIKSTILKRIYNRFLCDVSLEIEFEELNCYPSHWICFQNGMYDCKQKKLLPHDPKYRAINQIPHCYDPAAKYKGEQMEAFLDFICPVFNSREMLLEFIGYCFTKDVRQQKFLILNGEGGSGKSTLIRLVEAAVGSRNTSNISLTDLQQRFASFGLLGKLLNSCADLEISALEDTAIIKKILGEDTLRAEQKGKDAISFKNYAKLIFSTNELPVVKSEKTNGFYRRLLILPMNSVPEKKNPNLLNELLQELDYLIQLSIQALERMYENKTITISDESEEAVAQLRMDSDTVQAFIIEMCTEERGKRAERIEFYEDYCRYCEDVDRQSLSRNNFYRSLRSKGYGEIKANGHRFFKGIFYGKNCPKTALESFESVEQPLPF